MTEETEPKPLDYETAYAGSDEFFANMMDDYEAPAPESDEQEAQPEPEAAPVDDEGATAQPAVDSAEVAKARKQAVLAKLPQVESASDEELLAWYSGHSKNESDVRRAFRERAELERELADLKATRESEPAVPTDSSDQELVGLLTEEFGEERGKKVAELISARDARAQARVAAIEAALEGRLAKSVWKDVSQTLGVKDRDGSYDRVMEQAQSLAKVSGPWTELKGDARAEALITAAARLVMPDLPSPSELKRRAAISAAKKNGTATAAPQRAVPQKPKTADEIADAKLAAIVGGERDISKLRSIG